MRKPNYRFARAERDWTKRAKKEEKARRHQERASQQTSEQAESIRSTTSDKPTMNDLSLVICLVASPRLAISGSR